jgi:hypothetical protein
MPNDDTPPTLFSRFVDETDAECPRCRYQLRGIHGSACPECGRRLELRICTLPPRLDAFFLGVIALAFPTGYTGIWVVSMLWYGIRKDQLELLWNPGMVRIEVGFAINGAALITWVLMRRWLAERRPRTMALLAIVPVALFVVTVAAFGYS